MDFIRFTRNAFLSSVIVLVLRQQFRLRGGGAVRKLWISFQVCFVALILFVIFSFLKGEEISLPSPSLPDSIPGLGRIKEIGGEIKDAIADAAPFEWPSSESFKTKDGKPYKPLEAHSYKPKKKGAKKTSPGQGGNPVQDHAPELAKAREDLKEGGGLSQPAPANAEGGPTDAAGQLKRAQGGRITIEKQLHAPDQLMEMPPRPGSFNTLPEALCKAKPQEVSIQRMPAKSHRRELSKKQADWILSFAYIAGFCYNGTQPSGAPCIDTVGESEKDWSLQGLRKVKNTAHPEQPAKPDLDMPELEHSWVSPVFEDVREGLAEFWEKTTEDSMFKVYAREYKENKEVFRQEQEHSDVEGYLSYLQTMLLLAEEVDLETNLEGFPHQPKLGKMVNTRAWKYYLTGLHARPALICRPMPTSDPNEKQPKMYTGINLCFTKQFEPADCPRKIDSCKGRALYVPKGRPVRARSHA